MRRLAFALLIALVPAIAEAAPADTSAVVRGAIETYVRPGFHAFAVEATALQQATAALCAAPGAGPLAAARAQFGKTALAFARVEFVRFGPLAVADRLERLLFWPDLKGIALRQVQAALAGKDPSTLDPQTLKGKSVAMQGLVALEYLLFGAGSDDLAARGDAATYRCGYAAASATLAAGLATTIDAEWQDNSPSGAVARMLAPTPESTDYRSPTEVLQKLVQALFVGTDIVRDQRLSPIIAASEAAPRPRAALFWRSGLTFQVVAADFAGLREFFVAADLVDVLTQAGHGDVANGVLFEFGNAIKAAELVTLPVEQAVADPEQFRQLRLAAILTRSLDTLLGENLTDALGLTSGFSLLDGD